MDELIVDARVVVADPRPAVLLTSRTILEAEGIEVVATATNLDSATQLAAERNANVIVVDLHMLEGSSRAMIAGLRLRLPGVAIVILTMEAESAYVPAVLDAGACAYVLKDYAEADLTEAVRRAVLGHRFVSGKVAA